MIIVLDKGCFNWLKHNVHKIPIGSYISDIEFEDVTLKYVLENAFAWSSSPQGHDFWTDAACQPNYVVDQLFLDCLCEVVGESRHKGPPLTKQDCM